MLRGHEGGPLVIGDTMYLSTPFPNTVFALDLNQNGRINWKYEPKQDSSVIPVMCCDTVNRGVAYGEGMIFLHQADTTLVALDAKTGKVAWSVKDGDPGKGETGTSAPLVVKDKVLIGISGGEFGIQGRMTAYNIKDGSKAWKAYTSGPDDMIKFDPKTTMSMGKPVGKNSSLDDLAGRPVEDRRRRHLGLDLLRSEAEPDLLRLRQPGHLEPDAAPRRQQVVDDDLRARCRHRRGEMGLSDDPARPVGL